MTKTINSREKLSRNLTLSTDLTSNQRQSDKIEVNKNSSREGSYVKLSLSATGMQVVHATNGRIRIKATDGSFSSSITNITQYLKQYQGVKEVTTNEQTLSMVVMFDENKLSLAQMLGILQQFNIQLSPDSPLSDPFAPWKSIDFWKEQTVSFIPLMTGLAVTGGLGVSGLAAIPIYMITADATRLVIDYLEPQITGLDGVKDSAKAVVKTEECQSTTGDNKTTQTTVKSGKVTYSVVHEIPGRIRFHIPQIASDRAYAKRLERLLKVDPLVSKVRINGDAASLAIAYQGGKVATSHWVSLMELALQTTTPTQTITKINQSTDIAIEKLSTTSPTLVAEAVSQPTQLTEAEFPTSADQTLNVSNLWVDMKPAALSYSLNFIANLPL